MTHIQTQTRGFLGISKKRKTKQNKKYFRKQKLNEKKLEKQKKLNKKKNIFFYKNMLSKVTHKYKKYI